MTHPMSAADVAQRITEARKGLGLSLRTLAAKAGLSEASLRRKLGRRPDLLTLDDMLRLSDALELPLPDLIQIDMSAVAA